MLREFTGELGSPDHLAWIEEGRQLHKAYRAKRRAWLRACNWPWPSRKPVPVKPDPATLDAGDAEEG